MINGTNMKKAYYYLKKNGIKSTFYATFERILNTDRLQYRYAPITPKERIDQSNTKFDEVVTFSILVPMYETNEEYAKEMIESVLIQTYPDFELILADASTSQKVEKVVRSFSDVRIKYIKIDENRGISENTNVALKEASGDYIGLLDHDDLLTEDALFEMRNAIEKAKEKDIKYSFLYSDEDKCDSKGICFYEPNIKPKFNLDLLLSNNYICHFLVMRSCVMKELSFRKAFDGAQDHDLALRAYKNLDIQKDALQIGHVAKVLYHWRCHDDSTAANPQSKRYAYEAGRNAVKDFLGKYNIHANVIETKHNGFFRIDYGKRIGEFIPVFNKRGDIGVVAGPLYKKNKITSGILNSQGVCPYMGLNRNYSGYLHRAILQQDCDAADIRNMIIRRELSEELLKILKKENIQISNLELTQKNERVKSEGVQALSFVEEKNLSDKEYIDVSLKFCHAVKEKGYLILWDPYFE